VLGVGLDRRTTSSYMHLSKSIVVSKQILTQFFVVASGFGFLVPLSGGTEIITMVRKVDKSVTMLQNNRYI